MRPQPGTTLGHYSVTAKTGAVLTAYATESRLR